MKLRQLLRAGVGIKATALIMAGAALVACGSGNPSSSSSQQTSSSVSSTSSVQSSESSVSSVSSSTSSIVSSSSSVSSTPIPNTEACPYETGLGVGSGGYQSACAVLENGGAACVSSGGSVSNVTLNGSPASDLVAITHGAYGGELCAVNSGGEIYCGRDGSLDTMPYSGGGVDFISTNQNGGDFCAMGDGNSLICGNASGASEEQLPERLTQLHCFRNGCCGVTESGGMWCDADKDRQLTRDQQDGKDLVVVSGGDEATCGVFDDGSVKCWGASWNGQIGVGDNSGAPKPGREPINIEGDVLSTALGQHFSCWLVSGGEVYCSGIGTANGAGGESETPVLINGPSGQPLTDMVDITAARGFACATNRSGDLFCWGSPSGGATAKQFDVGGRVRVPAACQ